MQESRTRRLAAIVAADVIGYSRLVGIDEEGALDALRAARRDVVDPLLATHRGRIANTAGDSFLAEFASIVDAVRCAVAIQEAMTARSADVAVDRRLLFRIGINVGDVVAQGGDLLGDGVNVAARLEGLAEPAGIALSDDAYRQVRDRVDIEWRDGGVQELKNIARSVRVWRWSAVPADATIAAGTRLALPDKPSIAVLPFENMSRDSEQEYFSDGVTEDLITALSHIRWLFVIARNSTFAYKGRHVDVREIARELGVRYVLEGSVRRAGARIRLTAQLIEGPTGNHVWADRYDRDLADVFDLQDELTATVVGAIEPELSKAEQARARRKKPESLDIWDVYLSGLASLNRLSRDSLAEADRIFQQVVAAEPDFAAAHAGLAEVSYYNLVLGFTDDPGATRVRAIDWARQAIRHDSEDAGAHCTLGRACLLNRQFDEALAEFHAALQINPSHALAHYGLGATYVFTDNAQDSFLSLEQAIRLSPKDAHMGSFLVRLSQAHLYLRNHEQAVIWARKALMLPSFQWSRQMMLAAALGHLGRVEEAAAVLRELTERVPQFSWRYVLDYSPMVDGQGFRHMIDGLRKAGLPDG